MFTRTASGLANEYLFYDVDYVVYCEGETGEGEISSLDELFWSQLFSKFGKLVKCKSSGTKPELEALARYVVDNNIPNIIIAMDRDYSDLLGEEIIHPRIIYTFGYSWESDIVLDFPIATILNLFQTVSNTTAIEAEFIQFRNENSKKLVRAYALDYKYYRHSKALFNRHKPNSIIIAQSQKEPSLNIPKLLESAKLLGKFQSGHFSKKLYQSACGMRSFFGKTILRLTYRWFEHRSKIMPAKGRSCQIDTFASTMIFNLNFDDQSISRNKYYHQKLSAL